jgi:hypothetical protein
MLAGALCPDERGKLLVSVELPGVLATLPSLLVRALRDLEELDPGNRAAGRFTINARLASAFFL